MYKPNYSNIPLLFKNVQEYEPFPMKKKRLRLQSHAMENYYQEPL